MDFLKKYLEKYTSYIRTGIIAIVFLLVAVPFVKLVSTNGRMYTSSARYKVVLNGNEIGYVRDASIAENALLDARTKLGSAGSLTLVEADMSITLETDGGEVLSEEQISKTIYDSLTPEVQQGKETITAYTVRIDDFTVTLKTLDDVKLLFEKVKGKYCDSEKYETVIKAEDTGAYNVYRVSFNEKYGITDSYSRVGFSENIEIIETKQNASKIVSVDEAYELITKEHAEKGTYTIVSGDCLSSIARDHNITLDELLALNYGFTVNTAIYVGDVVVVTVPKAEISVEVVQKKEYEETYNAPVQYVDNAALYVGRENVIQAGSEGERDVVADITYVNGTETSREILEESIIKESVPRIIERGTKTPPTFIKPVNCSLVTSPWGYRTLPFAGFHYGVDWGCPSGTSVKATSSGTVILAGWNGTQGIAVHIRHTDGTISRYAHLNAVTVTYGQTVMQGQQIGLSGNTGNSTGPHLHFELWIGGASVNPLAYVK